MYVRYYSDSAELWHAICDYNMLELDDDVLNMHDENDNEEYLAVLSMLQDRRAVSLSDEGDFLASMYMLEESGGGASTVESVSGTSPPPPPPPSTAKSVSGTSPPAFYNLDPELFRRAMLEGASDRMSLGDGWTHKVSAYAGEVFVDRDVQIHMLDYKRQGVVIKHEYAVGLESAQAGREGEDAYTSFAAPSPPNSPRTPPWRRPKPSPSPTPTPTPAPGNRTLAATENLTATFPRRARPNVSKHRALGHSETRRVNDSNIIIDGAPVVLDEHDPHSCKGCRLGNTGKGHAPIKHLRDFGRSSRGFSHFGQQIDTDIILHLLRRLVPS